MPEGDTIHGAARRIREALVGATVERVDGSHPGLRENAHRLSGLQITAVEAVGKHLVVDFERDWSLRTHLGMPGVWHVYRRGERWRRSPGKARVVIRTPDHEVVAFSAPSVTLGKRHQVERRLSHLGPDLLGDDPVWAEIASRAASSDAETAADLLLDQRVMAGIGNVYKNEVLFLEGVAPATPVTALSADDVVRLAKRGRRLLRANVTTVRRSTTGERRSHVRTWVYGRAGQPCRRCGTEIETDRHGELDRLTYFCPSCQAPQTP